MSAINPDTGSPAGYAGKYIKVGENRRLARLSKGIGTDTLVFSYRVRAINTDETDADGRTWSRHASTICTGGILDQPGISIPTCQDNGVFMFWHTRNRARGDAPEGWQVERRHW